MNSIEPSAQTRRPRFLLAFAFLLAIHSPLFAQIVSERSVPTGTTPINVTFTNQMASTVNAFWVDTQGTNQSVGLLLPNQTIQITTFPGHVTIFKSGTQIVAKYKGTTLGNKAFSIVGPTGRPANAAPIASLQVPTATIPGSNTSANRGNNTLSNIGSFLQTLSNTIGNNRSGRNNSAGTSTGTSTSTRTGGTANSNSNNFASLLNRLANGGSQGSNSINSNNSANSNSNPSPSTDIPVTLSTTTANFRQDSTLNLPIDPANPDTVSIQIAIAHVTNEQRKQNGLSELVLSKQHSAAAQDHSVYMRSIQNISHQNNSDPTKASFSQRSALQGANNAIAENVLYNWGVNYVSNTPFFPGQAFPRHTAITMADAMVTQWMNSPPHRTNILTPGAKGIGVGVAIDTNAATVQLPKAWATQVFSN